MTDRKRLGVGFIGSGFIARFHLKSWVGVRDADVLGIWSPTQAHREDAAEMARSLRIGDTQPYDSITDMVAAPDIDCIWILGPNHKRIENLEEIVDALKTGKGELTGVAIEKPLARNVAEAKRVVELVEEAEVLHGYLEDQVFLPSLTKGRELVWRRGAATTGRPYLARANEEHAGPHAAWFWDAQLQGGGAMTDMMCHTVEVGRFLLTEPGADRDSIQPTKISCDINCLKWSRPEYAKRLQRDMDASLDYRNRPAEDFSRANITYKDQDGNTLVAEIGASWSFIGAGLRLQSELLGPEYSMSVNSLDTGNKVFFSREVEGEQGEDLVEKQNAEQGLMPYISDEPTEYGYMAENRHFVQHFLDGKQPDEDVYVGLEVMELLMTCYMSAEEERTIKWKPDGLDDFVPQVAQGEWQPA